MESNHPSLPRRGSARPPSCTRGETAGKVCPWSCRLAPAIRFDPDSSVAITQLLRPAETRRRKRTSGASGRAGFEPAGARAPLPGVTQTLRPAKKTGERVVQLGLWYRWLTITQRLRLTGSENRDRRTSCADRRARLAPRGPICLEITDPLRLAGTARRRTSAAPGCFQGNPDASAHRVGIPGGSRTPVSGLRDQRTWPLFDRDMI